MARLQAIPEYVTLFRDVFGEGTSVDASRVAQAIAAFERSLVAMNSPFDRFRAGDRNALTEQQRRGLDTFDEIGCDRCHSGPMFSEFDLEAEGVPEHPLLAEPDRGDGRFRFRLDPEPVVHRAPELLLAPEVRLRRLDGDVPQEKLNLIQLAAGQMAQAGAGPSEVVRRQSFDESPRVTVS